MLHLKNPRADIGQLLTILTIVGIATIGIGIGISSATTYNVVSCGANPSGQKDSTVAIAKRRTHGFAAVAVEV
ncbi:MAG: hypothetical protein ACYCRE_06950 [Acidobacteriaceae bacterium]